MEMKLFGSTLCFFKIKSKIQIQSDCFLPSPKFDFRRVLLLQTKACKIEVGLRNNFRLAGWDLGSPCVQAYHVILLNSRSLYPEFENELRKSACLSSFSKRWEGFVICLSCQLNYLQEIKQFHHNITFLLQSVGKKVML